MAQAAAVSMSPVDSSIHFTQDLLENRLNYDAVYTDVVAELMESPAYDAAAATMPPGTDMEEQAVAL